MINIIMIILGMCAALIMLFTVISVGSFIYNEIKDSNKIENDYKKQKK